jgi:cell division protein FtsQ
LQSLINAPFARLDTQDGFFEPKPARPAEAPLRASSGPKARRATLLESWSDAASRLGFVVSFFSLAAVGLYAFTISEGTGLTAKSPANILDEAAYSLGFEAKRITVEGLKNLPRSELQQALADPHYRSLVMFDTDAARSRLLGLGWVEKAQVQRTLPDQLHVSVVEREPFALWRSDDGVLFVIDQAGHKLGPAGERFPNLQVFAGEGAPAAAASLMPALAILKSAGMSATSAELMGGRYWQLTFDNMLVAKLPSEPDQALVKRLAGLLQNRNLTSDHVRGLDLRLPGRIIVELKDQTIAARNKLITLFMRANEPITQKAKKTGAS